MVKATTFVSGRGFQNFRGRFQTAHDRHADVQNDDVGFKFLHLGDGFPSVGGFAANLPSGSPNGRAQAAAHGFVIVGDENPQRRRAAEERIVTRVLAVDSPRRA